MITTFPLTREQRDANDDELRGILQVEKFRAWLTEHAKERVGYPNKCRECPVAEYVAAMTGHRAYVGYAGQVMVGDGPLERALAYVIDTSWVIDFTHRFDEHAHPGVKPRRLMGTTALRALRRACSYR